MPQAQGHLDGRPARPASRDVAFIAELLDEKDPPLMAVDRPNATKFEMHLRVIFAEEEDRVLAEQAAA
jgi:hypothetical protein